MARAKFLISILLCVHVWLHNPFLRLVLTLPLTAVFYLWLRCTSKSAVKKSSAFILMGIVLFLLEGKLFHYSFDYIHHIHSYMFLYIHSTRCLSRFTPYVHFNKQNVLAINRIKTHNCGIEDIFEVRVKDFETFSKAIGMNKKSRKKTTTTAKNTNKLWKHSTCWVEMCGCVTCTTTSYHRYHHHYHNRIHFIDIHFLWPLCSLRFFFYAPCAKYFSVLSMEFYSCGACHSTSILPPHTQEMMRLNRCV